MGQFGHRSLRVYTAALDAYDYSLRLLRSGQRRGSWAENQLMRALGSVALNIAEGVAEYSHGEKARFYRIARRSAAEAGAAFDLLVREARITPQECDTGNGKLEAVAAMLTVMIQRVRAAPSTNPDKPSSSVPGPVPVPVRPRARGTGPGQKPAPLPIPRNDP